MSKEFYIELRAPVEKSSWLSGEKEATHQVGLRHVSEQMAFEIVEIATLAPLDPNDTGAEETNELRVLYFGNELIIRQALISGHFVQNDQEAQTLIERARNIQ